MKTLVPIACATLIGAFFTSSAQACRVMLSPEQRVRDAYARNADLHVALVRIVDTRHLSSPTVREMKRLFPNYEPPWRATASVLRVISGRESPELILFDRNFGSAACDDGTSIPAKDDRWVVYYLVDSVTSPAKVLESYPLATAAGIDPRLRGLDPSEIR